MTIVFSSSRDHSPSLTVLEKVKKESFHKVFFYQSFSLITISLKKQLCRGISTVLIVMYTYMCIVHSGIRK